MAEKQFIAWDDSNFNWENNPYTWDEVFILIEIAEAINGGGSFEDVYQQLPEEKKKKLIKLVARVNGKTYEEEKYKQPNIKVIAKSVKVMIKEVLNIDVKIE